MVYFSTVNLPLDMFGAFYKGKDEMKGKFLILSMFFKFFAAIL